MAGEKSVRLFLLGDNKDAKAKIEEIEAKGDELAAKHPELKIGIDTAVAAEKLAILRRELKDTQAQANGARFSLKGFGGALSDLATGGLSGGISKMSLFQKALLAVNVATGIGEPAVAGLTVGVMSLASGVAAAGAGLGVFGLVAKSVYSQVSTAVKAYSTAQSTTGKANVAAMAKYRAELAALPPAQRAVAASIIGAQSAWQHFVAGNTAGVGKIMSQGIGLLPKVFAAMQPFLAPTEKALSGLISSLGKGLDSSGFKSGIDAFAKASGPNITNLGHAIGNIAVGIGGILRAFLPMATTMTGGLDKLTEKFAKWGSTLSSHSGFESLMTMAKQDAPLLGQVLKNLVTTIKNVGGAMSGLSTFSNSRMLLQLAVPLSSILKTLSSHPDLVNLALWGYAAYSGLNKAKVGLDSVKTGISGLKAAGSGLSNLSAGFRSSEKAADEASGAWGTAGGKAKTVFTSLSSAATTAGSKIVSLASSAAQGASSIGKLALSYGKAALAATAAAAKTTVLAIATGAQRAATALATGAQWLLNAAMDANPIGLIIIVIAALVVAFLLLWKHSAAFRNFWISVWKDVTHAISVVWNWIKSHWPLLLEILLGPIGIAAVQITKHWTAIKKGASDMFNSVINFFRRLPGEIIRVLGDMNKLLYNAGHAILEGLLNGIKAAWHDVTSFVSGIGGWISSHKGPIEVDAVLLRPHGRAIMGGLVGGLQDGMPGLTSQLSRTTNVIANTKVAGSLGGGSGAALQIEWVGGQADQEFMTWLKKNVRVRGGDPGVFGR